jgi:hypothetical protein
MGAVRGAGRIEGHPRQIVHEKLRPSPISKITRAKWTESMAQVVECLLCKGKDLSSNSSPRKKKKTANTFVTLKSFLMARGI